MSKVVELIILGEPESKQRPRYSMQGGFVRAYTPAKTANYEAIIKHEYKEKYGGIVFDRDTPIYISVEAYFGLSKGDFGKKGLNKNGREKIEMGYCTKHKDIDNIVKIVLDALNNICYVDDKQIVVIEASKWWTMNTPRVEITLKELEKHAYDSRT